MEFQPVRCPACSAPEHPGPVVLEVAFGLARGKCRGCRRRVWASSNGRELRIGIIDAPARKLKPLPPGGA